MKIIFFCPRWGCENIPWRLFFKKVKDAGYDGVEMGYPLELSADEKQEIQQGLADHSLLWIGQHWQTIEPDFEAHVKIYADNLYSIADGKPLFINSQTGKDYFSTEQNLRLIQIAKAISGETGIDIIHETHRGKWSFAAHITKNYLQLNPEIRITLDASHWCNVAETLLADQQEAVELAIKHTDHIHARVGYPEGPQVPDPRDPLWHEALQQHLTWWDTIVELKKQADRPMLTITPEFGAPPYTVLLPGSHSPIACQWDINVYMMEFLRDRYTR